MVEDLDKDRNVGIYRVKCLSCGVSYNSDEVCLDCILDDYEALKDPTSALTAIVVRIVGRGDASAEHRFSASWISGCRLLGQLRPRVGE